MTVVYVPRGIRPQQLDDVPTTVETGEFKDEVKRGRMAKVPVTREFSRGAPGAVHIRPNSTLTLTDDELAWLNKAHPDLAKQLRVIPGPANATTSAPAVATTVAVETPTTTTEATAVGSADADVVSESGGDKSKKLAKK